MSRNMFTHDPDPGDYFESQGNAVAHLEKQLAERDAQLVEAISIIENMDVLMDKAGMKTDLKPWLAKVRGGLNYPGIKSASKV